MTTIDGIELHAAGASSPGDPPRSTTCPGGPHRGADADAVAAATGAFVNDEPRYLQSTGFVLDLAGRVIVSVYAHGAIGRLVPDDVIGLVKCVRDHEAHERVA